MNLQTTCSYHTYGQTTAHHHSISKFETQLNIFASCRLVASSRKLLTADPMGPQFKSRRKAPLTIEEYERDFRRSADDLQLIERVFYSGLASNELRAALWPYLFGLVKHRGKFKCRTTTTTTTKTTSTRTTNGDSGTNHTSNHPIIKNTINGSNNLENQTNSANYNNKNNHQHYQHNNKQATNQCNTNGLSQNGNTNAMSQNGNTNGMSQNGNTNGMPQNGNPTSRQLFTSDTKPQSRYVFIEHDKNIERWRELEKLYYSYESQWRSIKPDQELRFSTFRERKALIERDVVRSDRSHPFYADNSTNLSNFTTLLMTYMMYDFDIGYLQGMSDLAAPILYIFKGDLVKSFWVFVEVMKLFRRNFEHSQKTIHFQLNCLYRLIKLTDPKFANYLRENDCSNCFFAFRSIVCQFKRELMRNNNSKNARNNQTTKDLEDDAGDDFSDNAENINQDEDDYVKVLNLWDTIWCVQRRHELLLKSKCVHTFTIASGASSTTTKPNMFLNPGEHIARQQHNRLHHHHHNHCHSKKTNNYQKNIKSQQNNNNIDRAHNQLESSINSHSNGTSNLANGNHSTNGHYYTTKNGHHHNTNNLSNHNHHHLRQNNVITRQTNGYSPSFAKIHRQQSITSLRSYESENGSPHGKSVTSRSLTTYGFHHEPQLVDNGSSDQLSNCSSSSISINGLSLNGSDQMTSCSLNSCQECSKKSSPVKQEQVVYTKETFYSSFDPNQADVPRFELTETEKFVLSLCLSLIRRERNHILSARMDASEIHQHFVKPRLAGNLTSFIDQAYELYDYINTDCDLQRLVKGANEPGDASDFSPVNGIDIKSNAWQKESDPADTYDLLKDYLIISPTSYDTSTSPSRRNLIGSINHISNRHDSSKYSVSQKSWDRFLNPNNPLGIE